jgi:hypothetical protein
MRYGADRRLRIVVSPVRVRVPPSAFSLVPSPASRPGRQHVTVRIGTWNLAGRYSSRHQSLLEEAACDVWLLTEVPAALDLSGHLVRSEEMRREKSWAAIWSAEALVAAPAVHPAAALARRSDLLLCCCVLPWRGGRAHWPDEGPDTAAITRAALSHLRPALLSGVPALVWGGDWNHAMSGREYVGSGAGRAAILDLVAEARLQVVTGAAAHAQSGLLSIDHIAVPAGWRVSSCQRLAAEAGNGRLSDHDAYLVDCGAP